MSRIVCFVVDTSVSMGQSLGGLSALDASKAACEHYLKKSAFGKTEKVMLVSCGSGMSGVLCGWKDPPSRLLEQLKSLKAEDCSDLGSSIRKAFDMLNFMRQQSGVDHLGAGRKPWSLLQAHVIVLTDGGSADLDVAAAAGSNNLLMPDWYRWDQRLFAVINSFPRLLGAPPEAVTDSPSCSKLQQLCEMTGGSAYFPTSLPSLLACMENILDRAQ
jgi:integrator complex subunit 6